MWTAEKVTSQLSRHRAEPLLESFPISYYPVSAAVCAQWQKDFSEFSRVARPVFRPYVHFSEPPFRSQSLNILTDPRGFEYRSNGTSDSPSSPVNEIYLFGGSTTFGYGVGDDWTIASRLEKTLNQRGAHWRVRNYGRASYSWFQELVLMARLIEAGARPNHVVFMEGVNLPRGCGAPNDSAVLARLWDQMQFRGYREPIALSFPLIRWINSWREEYNRKLFLSRYPTPPEGTFAEEVALTKSSYVNVTRSRNSVAKEFGAIPHFFWQPSRTYHCRIKENQVPAEWLPSFKLIAAMAETMSDVSLPDYTFLGELCAQEANPDLLFVDKVHYSPYFNDQIAQRIARRINGRQVAQGTHVIELAQ